MNAKHLEIVSHFAIRGTVTDIKPLGEGLINDTLLVKTAEDDAPDYVMQLSLIHISEPTRPY